MRYRLCSTVNKVSREVFVCLLRTKFRLVLPLLPPANRPHVGVKMLQDCNNSQLWYCHVQMTGQIACDLARCVTLEFYAKHAELSKKLVP